MIKLKIIKRPSKPLNQKPDKKLSLFSGFVMVKDLAVLSLKRRSCFLYPLFSLLGLLVIATVAAFYLGGQIDSLPEVLANPEENELLAMTLSSVFFGFMWLNSLINMAQAEDWYQYFKGRTYPMGLFFRKATHKVFKLTIWYMLVLLVSTTIINDMGGYGILMVAWIFSILVEPILMTGNKKVFQSLGESCSIIFKNGTFILSGLLFHIMLAKAIQILMMLFGVFPPVVQGFLQLMVMSMYFIYSQVFTTVWRVSVLLAHQTQSIEFIHTPIKEKIQESDVIEVMF